jgi:hypothetical protein
VNRRQLIGATGAILAATAAPALADTPALSPSLVAQAKAALNRHKDRVRNMDRIGIADFSTHASKPRLHVFDLQSGKVKSFLVAHGKGSDPAHTGWLKTFSNAPGSEATSQGAYLTADVYNGKHGVSRRLIGLDGDNCNALSRGIVIHSAPYVSDALARSGTLGRSQGCFAVSQADHDAVLNLLGPDRLLLAIKS